MKKEKQNFIILILQQRCEDAKYAKKYEEKEFTKYDTKKIEKICICLKLTALELKDFDKNKAKNLIENFIERKDFLELIC